MFCWFENKHQYITHHPDHCSTIHYFGLVAVNALYRMLTLEAPDAALKASEGLRG